jgi:origin recognition complex subunit 2
MESDSTLSADDSSSCARQNRPAQFIELRTSFDTYFTQASAPSKTSSTVFSVLVPPLSAEEYDLAIKAALPSLQPPRSSICSPSHHRSLFCRFLRELDEGFNLLFHGLGSKRNLVNLFATECSKTGHVVVVNGFHPNFVLKDMFNSIENIPELSDLLPATGIGNQAQRISDFFARVPLKRRLYLIIHNIDAPPFRTTKAKSCLSLFATNPGIRLVASTDRINMPLWSSTELSTRECGSITSEQVSPRGFSWLMHDLTTLMPYDVELLHADRSSISGAHGKMRKHEVGGIATQGGIHMTESAAAHILASVTEKAKLMFILMAKRQLECMSEAGDSSLDDLQQFGIGRDTLSSLTKDNFIATNDTALQSMLGEFRDHGLVLATQGSEETLWIPLRKERLSNVLQTLQTNQTST